MDDQVHNQYLSEGIGSSICFYCYNSFFFFLFTQMFLIVKFVIWHKNVILFWIFNSLEVFIWHFISHILLLEGDEFLDIRIHVKLCHRVWHKSYIWLWKILCYRDYSFNFLSLRAIDLCVIFVSIFCTLILRKIIHFYYLYCLVFSWLNFLALIGTWFNLASMNRKWQ